MRQCIFVVGTRAQLVKISPVLRLAVQTGLRHTVLFTGQHHDSIDDLITDFELTSKIIQPEGRSEKSSIGKLLLWLPATFYRCNRYIAGAKTRSKYRPLVVVHGDTLSTLIGALAGRLAGADIVHLESGLSSGKWSDPFPEEMLRRFTFKLTQFAICPNDEASERMHAYSGCIVLNTHENTLLDCVRFALRSDRDLMGEGCDFVVSIHRYHNIFHREALQRIVSEIIELARIGTVWFILHPPTEIRLKKYGFFEQLRNQDGIRMLPRMPYTEFLELMNKAKAVFSDGGSNQEELSYLGVPTVLYRDRSERPDGLGANIRFRSELENTPAECVKSGEIERLRRVARVNDAVQPSQLTVEALLKWTGELPADQTV